MTESISKPPTIATLRVIPPAFKRLLEGTLLLRVYRAEGSYKSRWNRFRDYGPVPGGRFDHHLPPPHEQTRRILYCAEMYVTCLAEAFQDTRFIDPYDSSPFLTAFELHAEIELLDLTDRDWLAAINAPEDLCSGDRESSQAWSQRFYDAYPEIQGIYYASARHDGGKNAALYERAMPGLPSKPVLNLPLADPGFEPSLRNAAMEVGYGFPWNP